MSGNLLFANACQLDRWGPDEFLVSHGGYMCDYKIV